MHHQFSVLFFFISSVILFYRFRDSESNLWINSIIRCNTHTHFKNDKNNYTHVLIEKKNEVRLAIYFNFLCDSNISFLLLNYTHQVCVFFTIGKGINDINTYIRLILSLHIVYVRLISIYTIIIDLTQPDIK